MDDIGESLAKPERLLCSPAFFKDQSTLGENLRTLTHIALSQECLVECAASVI